MVVISAIRGLKILFALGKFGDWIGKWKVES